MARTSLAAQHGVDTDGSRQLGYLRAQSQEPLPPLPNRAWAAGRRETRVRHPLRRVGQTWDRLGQGSRRQAAARWGATTVIGRQVHLTSGEGARQLLPGDRLEVICRTPRSSVEKRWSGSRRSQRSTRSLPRRASTAMNWPPFAISASRSSWRPTLRLLQPEPRRGEESCGGAVNRGVSD